MENFCVHALESLLRGSDWEEKFQLFYHTVCPRFKNFNRRSEQSSSDVDDGSGYDLLMFDAYKEFLSFFDDNIQIYLDKMGVTQSTLADSFALNLKNKDSSAERLFALLEMYSDFEKFSYMMRCKFEEIFVVPKIIEETKISSSLPENLGLQSITPNHQRQTDAPKTVVRVLWDIENIPVPKVLGGLNTISKLNSFLKSKKLFGPGIDCRTTAFFSPSGGNVSERVVNELDHSAVELVWVSAKREDADRKLGIRINQEMLVLQPSVTTFVIISSDQDFRHHMQLLQNQGFNVVVIHNADNEKWTQVLEMHASESYRWMDIMDIRSSNVCANGTVAFNTSDNNNNSDDNSSNSTSNNNNNDNKINQIIPAVDDSNEGTINSLKGDKGAENSWYEGWREGSCIRWNGVYGFLSVVVQSPDKIAESTYFTASTDSSAASQSMVNVRVYALNKSLSFDPPRMQLRKGERVRVLVTSGDRGPRAVKVESTGIS